MSGTLAAKRVPLRLRGFFSLYTKRRMIHGGRGPLSVTPRESSIALVKDV
jgi:hypothetical protein